MKIYCTIFRFKVATFIEIHVKQLVRCRHCWQIDVAELKFGAIMTKHGFRDFQTP